LLIYIYIYIERERERERERDGCFLHGVREGEREVAVCFPDVREKLKKLLLLMI
jgi:hypothetical protein